MMTTFDIHHWDVMKMFKAPVDETNCGLPMAERVHLLMTDKTEINKIFFAQHELEKDDWSKQLGPVLESFKDTHVKAYGNIQGYAVQTIKNHHRDKLQSVSSYITEINHAIRAARDAEILVKRIENKDWSIEKEVTRILIECPFYKFETIYNREIRFVTRTHIVLTEKNEAAGIDLSVDLGRFMIGLDVANARLNAYGWENSTFVGALCHPHIDQNHQICFGDQYQTYADAMVKMDYVTAMQTAMKILTTYTIDGNHHAFARLADFKFVQDQQREGTAKPKVKQNKLDQAQIILKAIYHEPNYTWTTRAVAQNRAAQELQGPPAPEGLAAIIQPPPGEAPREEPREENWN